MRDAGVVPAVISNPGMRPDPPFDYRKFYREKTGAYSGPVDISRLKDIREYRREQQ